MAKKKKKKNGRGEETGREPVASVKGLMGTEPKVGMIAVTNERLLGSYCNAALIHHTRLEVVFDFIWALGEQQILGSRVITSPEHAKRIYEALGANIDKYENQYGKIELSKVRSKKGG